MPLCDYGCGLEANFVFKSKKQCCSSHTSKCPARKAIVSKQHKGKIPWSKGKNKNTDSRIAALSEKLKGRVVSQYSIEKFKQTKKLNNKPPWNKNISKTDPRRQTGSKNGMYGKTHTIEVKEKLRTLAKQGNFAGENNPWYGKSRTGELSPRYRHDINHTEFKLFRNRTTMLTEKTYKKYKDEINPNNLPRAKAGIDGGYHLDHKVSVIWGFENGWSPEQLSAKENLQMLPWLENVKKHGSCSL